MATYFLVEVTYTLTAEQARQQFPDLPWNEMEAEANNTPLNPALQSAYSHTYTKRTGADEGAPPMQIRAWVRRM